MSIINTMLQDLDKRHGRPGGEAVGDDAVRSIKPKSRWHVSRNTAVMLAGLVGASAAGAWWMQHRASPIVVLAPPVPVIASNAAPVAARAVPAAPVAAAVVAVSPPAKVEVQAPADAAPPLAAPASRPPAPLAATAKAPRLVAMVSTSTATPVASPNAFDKVDTPMSPVKTAAVNTRAASAKTYSPSQLSANLLGEAVMLDQQGHQEEAKALLQRALVANPIDIQTRQMLVRLQMDTGRIDEARALLAEGQRLHPEQPEFTLALARLKVEAGDSNGAIQLLEAGRVAARDEPQYHALFATLLLRAQRYDDAVQHYIVALRSDPANTRWLIGAGVALEGVGKQADAAEAYLRAEGAANLTPEMASFLSERLARLRNVTSIR
jgi:MSHA biogenesis protein MshN